MKNFKVVITIYGRFEGDESIIYVGPAKTIGEFLLKIEKKTQGCISDFMCTGWGDNDKERMEEVKKISTKEELDDEIVNDGDVGDITIWQTVEGRKDKLLYGEYPNKAKIVKIK